jgi:hypothetical protein
MKFDTTNQGKNPNQQQDQQKGNQNRPTGGNPNQNPNRPANPGQPQKGPSNPHADQQGGRKDSWSDKR